MIARRAGACIVLVSFAVAALTLQPGCGHACTAEERLGLSIEVRDAKTGASLCDASVVAFDGSYREELNNFAKLAAIPPPCRFGGAAERPGTYRVEVSRAGYLSKQLPDLTVYQLPGDCHISNFISLNVDLEPDPSAPPMLDAGTHD